ncbi:xylulokinase [Spirabiliibacterium falconis]|uniref:xylulokinase n=1 Tax=Spirabiliibacterium falconis TaxID=572023 RepID=UPI001AAD0757|nr:xylulokinase [Spirabiliibacterium falconis]MBE2894366.1 xylulokinase [Spirabiliibacterium falconis]
MYIGIDLGTSGVKTVLLDEQQHILATTTAPLPISRPQPLWSEQHPQDWWHAVNQCMAELSQNHDLNGVKAIGLTGQMHGAVMLDRHNNVLYPAILWNDGRSFSQCQALESAVANSREITGNLMMPGFTAPKIQWIAKHQPAIFAQLAKVLLPKDYLRFLMTGEFASEMSDAAGTMWLNVGLRRWDSAMLDACGLTEQHMPTLFEGNQITGYLLPELATTWKMKSVPVIAGGGDNAAGAIGVGLHEPRQAMLSLGTSGVYFIVSDRYLSNPESAVHSFCHALPDRWHLMSVMLSAASAIDWANRTLGINDIERFFTLACESENNDGVLFLPYLSGERTPHNDPYAKGVFWGMTHNTTTADLARSVVEGVSFALADGIDAVHASGITAEKITLIGGGSKSHFWRQLLADVSGYTFEYRTGGDVGPALGAAKLAQMACHPETPIADICPPLPLEHTYTPQHAVYQHYQPQRERFRILYQKLKGIA